MKLSDIIGGAIQKGAELKVSLLESPFYSFHNSAFTEGEVSEPLEPVGSIGIGNFPIDINPYRVISEDDSDDSLDDLVVANVDIVPASNSQADLSISTDSFYQENTFTESTGSSLPEPTISYLADSNLDLTMGKDALAMDSNISGEDTFPIEINSDESVLFLEATDEPTLTLEYSPGQDGYFIPDSNNFSLEKTMKMSDLDQINLANFKIKFSSLVSRANELIYSEVKEQARSNGLLVFDIYQTGQEKTYHSKMSNDQVHEKVQYVKSIIRDRVSKFKEVASSGGPNTVLTNFLCSMEEFVPLSPNAPEYSESGPISHNNQQFLSYLVKAASSDYLIEQNVLAAELIKEAPYFKETVLHGKEVIYSKINEIEQIPLDADNDYFQSKVSGVMQIIAGGKITNGQFPEVSIYQNDGSFPNLQYSSATKSALEPILTKMQSLLDSAYRHGILSK